MARQFFEGNSTIPSAGPNLVPSANVSVPEFARLAEMNARASVDPTGSLIREQHHVQASFFDERKEASPWAAEFGAVHPLTMAPPTQRNPSTPMECKQEYILLHPKMLSYA